MYPRIIPTTFFESKYKIPTENEIMPKFKPETTSRWVKNLEKKVCVLLVGHNSSQILWNNWSKLLCDVWSQDDFEHEEVEIIWILNLFYVKIDLTILSIISTLVQYSLILQNIFTTYNCPYIFLCCSSHTKSKAFYTAYVTYYYYLGQTMYL